jgi:hypothetical protein
MLPISYRLYQNRRPTITFFPGFSCFHVIPYSLSYLQPSDQLRTEWLKFQCLSSYVLFCCSPMKLCLFSFRYLFSMYASCLPLLHLHHFFLMPLFPLYKTQPLSPLSMALVTSCSAFLRHQHALAVRHGGSPRPESMEGLLFNASKGQITILTPLKASSCTLIIFS